ncbi:homoserine O-succinyltransferase [Aliikangiella marina]|uniref:Homoserine O-succinyltransferase n=1 Tax=Aliikangiella marina TaxID=1712262 RepID=A0A545TD60_9GAMM|nr:homoserine O-succinyltransferase [Aliikangiella marina]TQV75158.1 homoserine O-succinyltransferase [Aliikangiella marina]
MPLVAFNNLPTYARLKAEHHDVIERERAEHQDIRELHIGLYNLMPDASLQATERQFMRLVGDCNQIVQFYVHLFTARRIQRGHAAQQWIDEYYTDFESIKKHGLDALIISGANPERAQLDQEDFWPELTQVIDWASENVTSSLCACLATHATLKYLYGIDRRPLETKRWGVFSHRANKTAHPLTRHTNTRYDVPHSRNNEVSAAQLESHGLKPLVESEQGGIHLAVSPDGIRFVYFQGHPEYDAVSLLKEYKREIDRWFSNQRNDYPPFPENYFNEELQAFLDNFKKQCELAKSSPGAMPNWPATWIEERLENTWRDTALSTFNNWLGLVYQLTHLERKLPFMSGVDTDNPLIAVTN